MLTNVQIRILKKISCGPPGYCSGAAYAGKSKLGTLMGKDFFSRVAGRVVIDFGCGTGDEAVEMALRGAERVIGLDISEERLRGARRAAEQAGLQQACCFTTSTNERADVIVSIDSFEHFGDPAAMLREMDRLLAHGGEIIACFGPTWYHPLGGHLFSVFPWAHLVFSEEALLRWRAAFKTDGATRFSEVAGGLNQMTITRFERLVAESPFRFAALELVPIRPLRHLQNRLTREFTTAIVRCRLVRRDV